MGYQLGIDLGTTYTAAAVCRSSDRRWVEPEVVSLGSRSATVASVLYLGPDGTVLVGEAAERRAVTDPDRVVREFKRRIGDPTPIVVAGRNWAPEELSARLVRWVVDRVAEREGGPADRIAITHPASWGSHKKDLLTRALGGQGLTVTFLAEPQAAALHYATAERVSAGSTIAVYDLGGGTFDAAVVRKGDARAAGSGPAGFGLLGRPEGLERLGGVDFDEVVFEHVRAGLPDAFDNLDDTDPAVLSAVARLRRDCTEAKEALSSDTEVSIPVLLPASRGSVRLHRSEFEQMIRPRVEETVDALRKAVMSAGLQPQQLSAVLLVGGSSRIPLVAQLVSEQLDRPVAVDADPKNAIAKGAALALSPKPTESWPSTTIPPVPGGARGPGTRGGAAYGGAALGGAALGGAALGAAAMGGGVPGGGAAAAAYASPARPPRPPVSSQRPDLATPSHGVRQAAAFEPPPRRPAGPTHEPATSLLSGGESPSRAPEQSWSPPVERAPAPSWDPEPDRYAEYADYAEPERRGLSKALLVGLGGFLAVVAILIGYFVLSGENNSPSGSTVDGTTETTTEDAPESESAEPRTTVPAAPAPGEPPAQQPDPDPPAAPSRTKENTKTKEPTTTKAPPPTTTVVEEPPPVIDPGTGGGGTGTGTGTGAGTGGGTGGGAGGEGAPAGGETVGQASVDDPAVDVAAAPGLDQ